jgi:CRISPR-associated protein Cmr3
VSLWRIEPRDPLIARDGRPASTAQLATLRFPFPSTLAGAVRTRMASAGGSFDLAGEALEELKRIEVHGPLLAEMAGEAEEVAQWYAPAPRDVLFPGTPEGMIALRRLRPQPLGPGQQMSDLGRAGELSAVLPAEAVSPGKPPHDLPAFWRWEAFARWLREDSGLDGEVDVSELGIKDLPVERRVHVALRPGERVGLDGMLFQTAGLRFLQGEDGRLAPRRFALSVRCEGGEAAGRTMRLSAQLAPLGGERRLAHWSPLATGWPGLPDGVCDAIVASCRARLILLTPAHFQKGALPGWSGGTWPLGGNVGVTVRAACVGRPEVVSGWDLACENPGKPRGRPKPTRRLAPAGSVYFIELDGKPEDLRRWCAAAWLAPISDGEQDRRDGFGLAALGTWMEEIP